MKTDNPNLHSVFPQHHAAFLPPDRQARTFVEAVQARPSLRGRVTAYDPKPGQAYYISTRGTVPASR